MRWNQFRVHRCFNQLCSAQCFVISFVLSSESTSSKFCFVFRFFSSESLRKGIVQSCRHCSNRFHQPCGFSRSSIAGSSFPALCRSMQLHQIRIPCRCTRRCWARSHVVKPCGLCGVDCWRMKWWLHPLIRYATKPQGSALFHGRWLSIVSQCGGRCS